jgi:hypothetical protein
MIVYIINLFKFRSLDLSKSENIYNNNNSKYIFIIICSAVSESNFFG